MGTDPTTEAPDQAPSQAPDQAPPRTWVTVAEPSRHDDGEAPVSLRRVALQLVAGILVVLAAVTVGGTLAARRLAEREAVNDAAQRADLLAETLVQPALTDRLLARDPAATATFDALVRDRVLGRDVAHVKLWTTDGTVLYSDESALVGLHFSLDPEQRQALAHPRTVAEISDLDREENSLDSSPDGKLVEVYRPVWTPGGSTMLFEIYEPYDQVSSRTSQLWRGFAGVTLTSLLLFVLLLVPLIWHLTARVRRDQRQRERLLQRAVEASSAERRIIAASLHDGPVQDLAATSFTVSAAAARASSAGQRDLERELREVAASVRISIRALRSLLVDIYPPSLAQAGLSGALADLAQSSSAPGLEVRVDHDPDADLGLTQSQERLVYRIAQETVRNAVKHAAPCTVTVRLGRDEDGVVLDVRDDGPGFDVEEWLRHPEEGHFGLRLLADLAASGGAHLAVASTPGAGTRWRLRIPERPVADDA
ncbi:MAG: ATP-binding protein [Marmoricola sp.]|nr:ATP-binding protein [Marmoricola sp.]